MLRFTPAPLIPAELQKLAGRSEALFSGSYAEQVGLAGRLWKAYKMGSAKEKAMSARPRKDRCVYCEENQGVEIDHLRPKTLHPWLTFCWENLIPACSTCGGPSYKYDKDAVLDLASPTGWTDISRARRRTGDAPGQTTPPANGRTAWWNPRLADPLSAMKLDIVGGSFKLLVTAIPGTEEHARATWTIEKLGLNRRPHLVRQREMAYGDYLHWLDVVVHAHQKAERHERWYGPLHAVDNLDVDYLAEVRRLQRDLSDRNHPTVWAEMKRQRADLPEVDRLLSLYPEVLSW